MDKHATIRTMSKPATFDWKMFRGLRDPSKFTQLYPCWESDVLNFHWNPVCSMLRNRYQVNIRLILFLLRVEVKEIERPGYDAACRGGEPIIWLDSRADEVTKRFMLAQMLYFILNREAGEYKLHFSCVPASYNADQAESWVFASELLVPQYLLNTVHSSLGGYSPVSWHAWWRGLFDRKIRAENKQLRSQHGSIAKMAEVLSIPPSACAGIMNIRYRLSAQT